ncbi:nucleotidyltransferase domain-containing protein [Candidatus Dependentiae bacterium]|nr:nucleotidyltransferase domain-containing protein [Candidatus Dependentiae bacterium]
MVALEDKTKLIEEITKHLPDVKIYLYGSRATGTHRPTSDIDLAVDSGKQISPDTMHKLNKDIEELKLTLEVEIVDMHSIPQGHIDRIEREKILWR